MAGSDFDIVLKKEAKTSLALFRDQSLLGKKFGREAVALYNAIDSGRTAAKLIAELGIPEEKFIEILEFMNNNAMVSVEPSSRENTPDEPEPSAAAPPQEPPRAEPEPPSDEPEDGKYDDDMLTPLEKILHDKYGATGVKVYNLIDGEKTAEEILKETRMSEAKLVEILEFMDEKGIIKLEKPPEPEPAKSAPEPEEPDEKEEGKPAREPRFSPIIEDAPEGKPFSPPSPPPIKGKEASKPAEKHDAAEELADEIIMVDVPAMSSLSLVQRAFLFTELSTRFGKKASDLMNMVDGNRDFVELSLSTGLSLFEIDSIMAYFGKKGFMTFRQLDRVEIKKKYGDDGFAIYKRHGRDGLLLYEMIGKEASLKDIILKSKIDPERAIDIFLFIHKVLGLDVPLDRDVIYRQIGLKK